MEAIILNTDFEAVAVVDNFDSFIWTDRFCGYGDFELYLPVENAPEELLTLDNYVSLNGYDRLMIIEKIEYSGDDEDGDYVTVSGRSLESILSRRIIWTSTTFSNSKGFQTAILKLISDAIITGKVYSVEGYSSTTGTNSKRIISNFSYETSTDTAITNLDLLDGLDSDDDSDVTYWGENLYNVILSLCENAGIGFKILFSSGNLIFSLFVGTDRSTEQTDNDWVIFSPEYGNALSTNYYKSSENYTTTYLLKYQDDDGTYRRSNNSGSSAYTGLARREIFVDLGSGDYMTAANMKSAAQEELEGIKEIMEVDVDPEGQFIYLTDYFVGDIVQVSDNYGHTGRKRVSEVIMSEDESGESLTISFSDLDDE